MITPSTAVAASNIDRSLLAPHGSKTPFAEVLDAAAARNLSQASPRMRQVDGDCADGAQPHQASGSKATHDASFNQLGVFGLGAAQSETNSKAADAASVAAAGVRADSPLDATFDLTAFAARTLNHASVTISSMALSGLPAPTHGLPDTAASAASISPSGIATGGEGGAVEMGSQEPNEVDGASPLLLEQNTTTGPQGPPLSVIVSQDANGVQVLAASAILTPQARDALLETAHRLSAALRLNLSSLHHNGVALSAPQSPFNPGERG